MYAGNLGTPQNLESFLNLFSESSNKYQITIFGGGSQYEKISGFESEKINVNPFVSRDLLVELTKDTIFISVSLSPNITVEGFPGKHSIILK